MNKNVLPLILTVLVFASCSSAYKSTQTPDDVYYSQGKAREYASVNNDNNSGGYDNYTSSNEDNYLRMKVQNRYQWDALDNNDYWYSPNYAYNNFYGFNSFNPYTFNSWGLSYYYSPFASLQPYSWFNNYYPSYGFGFGYSPYSLGLYSHGYGYGYYGYTPSTVIVNSPARARTSRPMLGSYVNGNYNNRNNYSNGVGNRYVPAGTGLNRYNNNSRYNNVNNNNSLRYNNNTNNNTPTFSAPARSYTPSSSGGGGGSVSRPGRH